MTAASGEVTPTSEGPKQVIHLTVGGAQYAAKACDLSGWVLEKRLTIQLATKTVKV